jgi:hypothetical protein
MHCDVASIFCLNVLCVYIKAKIACKNRFPCIILLVTLHIVWLGIQLSLHDGSEGVNDEEQAVV